MGAELDICTCVMDDRNDIWEKVLGNRCEIIFIVT
jgi:hypothetical protein